MKRKEMKRVECTWQLLQHYDWILIYTNVLDTL